MRVRVLTLGVLVISAGMISANTASASLVTFATNPTGQAYFYQPSGGTVGNQFVVGAVAANAVTVGVYDWGGDGFDSSHEVGIFTDTGTLLGSAVVPSGTAATLVGGFRWVSLTAPIYLAANTTYVVASYFSATSNDWFYGGSATIDSHFALTGDLFVDGGSALDFPTADFPNVDGWFGANFQAEPVPEPTTLTLLGSGLLAFVWRRRKGH